MSRFLLLDDGMQNVREMWFTKAHNNQKIDELLINVDMQWAEPVKVLRRNLGDILTTPNILMHVAVRLSMLDKYHKYSLEISVGREIRTGNILNKN
jgi:hypothetical protein